MGFNASSPFEGEVRWGLTDESRSRQNIQQGQIEMHAPVPTQKRSYSRNSHMEQIEK